jgi:hypothetical protein
VIKTNRTTNRKIKTPTARQPKGEATNLGVWATTGHWAIRTRGPTPQTGSPEQGKVARLDQLAKNAAIAYVATPILTMNGGVLARAFIPQSSESNGKVVWLNESYCVSLAYLHVLLFCEGGSTDPIVSTQAICIGAATNPKTPHSPKLSHLYADLAEPATLRPLDRHIHRVGIGYTRQ